MSDWKQNIPMTTRLRIKCRDAWVMAAGKINNCLRLAGIRGDELFRHTLIQTNYSCTRKCSFCHYGQEDAPRPYSMPSELFYSIIDQLAELKYRGRLGLFEMNEPLTDSRFCDFLKYARQKLPRAWIFISSNGDLLNAEKFSNLVALGLNYVFMSSYDQEALARNTEMLQRLSVEERKRIHHINRTYQEVWSSRGGNVTQFCKEPIMAPCDMVYRVLYIKPQGTVHSCYNDFHDKNIMGDLNHDSVLNIWRGEKFRNLRNDLLHGRRGVSELCRQCDYGGISNLPKIPLSWTLWGKQ